MEVVTTTIAVTTSGAAGSASGSATAFVPGFLVDIYLDYGAAPATTDVTISYAGRGGNILAVANANTDTFFAPRQKPVDNANAAITNANDKFLLDDRITVAVAQSDALAPAVTAYIRSLKL